VALVQNLLVRYLIHLSRRSFCCSVVALRRFHPNAGLAGDRNGNRHPSPDLSVAFFLFYNPVSVAKGLIRRVSKRSLGPLPLIYLFHYTNYHMESTGAPKTFHSTHRYAPLTGSNRLELSRLRTPRSDTIPAAPTIPLSDTLSTSQSLASPWHLDI
jgi:hypothetical protein